MLSKNKNATYSLKFDKRFNLNNKSYIPKKRIKEKI